MCSDDLWEKYILNNNYGFGGMGDRIDSFLPPDKIANLSRFDRIAFESK